MYYYVGDACFILDVDDLLLVLDHEKHDPPRVVNTFLVGENIIQCVFGVQNQIYSDTLGNNYRIESGCFCVFPVDINTDDALITTGRIIQSTGLPMVTLHDNILIVLPDNDYVCEIDLFDGEPLSSDNSDQSGYSSESRSRSGSRSGSRSRSMSESESD